PAPAAAPATAPAAAAPVAAVAAPVEPAAQVATPQPVPEAMPATVQAEAEPASSPEPVASAPEQQAAQADGVPPWEDLPADTPVAPEAAAKSAGSAALAVTPAVAAVLAPAPVPADGPVDGPPSWVDEEIPFEAEGGFVPDGGFTSDPDDDEFETLASSTPSAAPAAATPARREGPAPARKRQARARMTDMTSAGWPELAARLPVTGLAAELARQSEWAGVQGDAVVLRVAVKTLAESESRVRLQTVLCEHFGQGIRLVVEVGVTGDATAHAVAQAERAARQQAAEDAVAVDPFVQALLADFGGQIVSGSIRHVDPPAAA
ncbi:MAG: DNA polymerase III subunit gamma/tau, partial [Achromobacter pestifer]